nr:flavodoxin [uncultured Anaeromusa sp.]
MAAKNSLIAFYSRKGNNYVRGTIVNLAVGNTEIAAKKIQLLTGGHLFQIETIKDYPLDYTETTTVAQKEKQEQARPELVSTGKGMEAYDVIYLGYPNWWGTMPMAVFTWLEAHDFSGKTIIPFCTHEGSGLGSSENDLKKACPTAKTLPGLAIHGGSVANADKEIADWLKNTI